MNAIPYTVEPRPDTGVNNVQLGMWLFIASEVMLFGGLFSAYFVLRAAAPTPWSPLREQASGAVMATLTLLIASGNVAASASTLRHHRRLLVLAVLFAVSFCLHKNVEYHQLLRAGKGPASSTQMATYFLLTGVHLLHVGGGIAATIWLMLRSGGQPDPAPTVNRLRALTLYWGFVDAVWLVMLVLLYVA